MCISSSSVIWLVSPSVLIEQRAVGDAEVDAFLRGLAGEEAVGEAGGEAVAAADAVFDFQVVELRAVVELAICHRMADQSLIGAVFTPRRVVPTTLMFG